MTDWLDGEISETVKLISETGMHAVFYPLEGIRGIDLAEKNVQQCWRYFCSSLIVSFVYCLFVFSSFWGVSVFASVV